MEPTPPNKKNPKTAPATPAFVAAPPSAGSAAPPEQRPWRTRGLVRFTLYCFAALVVLWALAAYVVVPAAWRHYILRHPGLTEDMPRTTKDGDGRPGDPLNCALIGTQEEIINIFAKAGWQPADPITWKSCAKITSATVFKKCYDTAPVSNLYLWNRKQDMAFQKAVPKKPYQRHHVRFWKSAEEDSDGRPLWVGAATFDKSVGINKATGQPTHHIDKNVDEERDTLFADLRKTDLLAQDEIMQNFHTVKQGKNGGLDPWQTDGHLVIGYIARPRFLGLISPAIEEEEDLSFAACCLDMDHPAFEKLPKNLITSTMKGAKKGPKTPLNVALIGSKQDMLAIMEKAGWQRLEGSVLDGEPWNDLYLNDHRHDLAFQIAGRAERRHVCFWKSLEEDGEGRPLWLGTTYRTKAVPGPNILKVHHIDQKIDTDRDHLFAELAKTKMLAVPSRIEDFHAKNQGKTAAGDLWETDGVLSIGLIAMPDED